MPCNRDCSKCRNKERDAAWRYMVQLTPRKKEEPLFTVKVYVDHYIVKDESGTVKIAETGKELLAILSPPAATPQTPQEPKAKRPRRSKAQIAADNAAKAASEA